MIPQAFVDQLLQRVDIVDLVGQYVPLKKTGINFSGRCPFHSEKSPSFTVAPNKGFYHCFGCGANGNALRFVMEHLGMGFPQAVEMLAGRVGMVVPQAEGANRESPEAREARRTRRERLQARMLQAARFYQRRLKDSPKAIEYLKGRGIRGETAARFHLGVAPDGWQPLSSAFADYESEELEAVGLVMRKDESSDDAAAGRRYDRFRNRLMFPILSAEGHVIGFGARAFGDEKPKYLNSPETELFVKGQGLYGLHEARSHIRAAAEVWVVEGYMDVVALAQEGIGHAVATLGTATTTEQARLLFRQASVVAFVFDGDAAGRRAAARAMEQILPLAKDGLLVRFAFLPEGEDPDSLVRKIGAPALRALVAESPTLSQFFLEHCSEGHAVDTAEGRAAAAAEARRLFALMPPSLLKEQMLDASSAATQVSAASLDAGQRAPGDGGAFRPADRPGGAGGTPASSRGTRTFHGGRAAGDARPVPLRRSPVGSLDDRLLRLAVRHRVLMQRLHHQAREALPSGHRAALLWISEQPEGIPMRECLQTNPPRAEAMEGLRLGMSPDPALDEACAQADWDVFETEWADLERQLRIRWLNGRAAQAAEAGDAAALRESHRELSALKALTSGSA